MTVCRTAGSASRYAAVSAAKQIVWLTYARVTDRRRAHYGVSSGARRLAGSSIFRAALRRLRRAHGAAGRPVLAAAAGGRSGRSRRSGAVPGRGRLRRGAGRPVLSPWHAVVLNAVSGCPDDLPRRPARDGHRGGSSAILPGWCWPWGSAPCSAITTSCSLVGVRRCWRSRPRPVAAGRSARRPVADADAVPAAGGGLRTVWADRRVRALTGLVCAGFGVFVALTTWLQTLLHPAGGVRRRPGCCCSSWSSSAWPARPCCPRCSYGAAPSGRSCTASVVAGAAALVVLAALPGFGAGLAASAVLGLFLLTDLPVIFDRAEQVAGRCGRHRQRPALAGRQCCGAGGGARRPGAGAPSGRGVQRPRRAPGRGSAAGAPGDRARGRAQRRSSRPIGSVTSAATANDSSDALIQVAGVNHRTCGPASAPTSRSTRG